MSILPRHRPTRSGRRPDRDRRAGERRVLYVGLAVSFILHFLLIVLASRWLEPADHAGAAAPDPMVVQPDDAMRAVALSDGTSPAPGPEATVSPPISDPAPPAAVPEEDEEDAPEDEPAELRTAAERLAPRLVDPRLWEPMVLLPREPTLEDVQDRIAAAMEMMSDSALAEAERAMRARDWTVEDGSGGRWGISPGKIHLGSVTLPLPLFFPVDMEAEARQAYWDELETQLDRAEFLESFDNRVRAIRERRERERAEDRTRANDGSG